METFQMSSDVRTPMTFKRFTSSNDEVLSIHVEDAKSDSPGQREHRGPAWLQLNPDTETTATQTHPAPRNGLQKEPNETETVQWSAEKEGLPYQQADGTSQVSPDTEGAQDKESVRTDPTETFASAVESRCSETFDDTDSINVDPPEIPLRILTMNEISKHNKLHDMWIVINNEVYDVTQFQHRHPGGPKCESLWQSFRSLTS